MRWVEYGSVAVLLIFFLTARQARPWHALAVALGAFAGEEICIRAYGAYDYSPAWSLFIDRMPVAVLLIWPAVVLSARAVAQALFGRAHPLVVGALVLFDAALVEPVATHSGLWTWHLPGAFGVPPIGPVGWGCYAAAVSFLLDRADAGPRALLAALGAPLLAHAGILAAWWGALRWVQGEISPGAAAAASLVACAGAAVVAWRAPRLPWREAIPRAAAASIFAGLLAAAPDRALVLYAAPFAAPWLFALDWRLGAQDRPR